MSQLGESPRDRANRTQREASDPAVSAFVAASAGSGKTKLLTDRLLRLMLMDGVRPERIQCLTFTKAAAAEMSLRLQRQLGEWVTLDDAKLDERLRNLAVDPVPDARRRARELFAHVLDLPGGMRIGTIHAFCQSLLRRFPLEAKLSPHFQLVDDRDAADALTEARETMLAQADQHDLGEALGMLAGLATLGQFGDRVDDLRKQRGLLAALLVALRAGKDLPAAQRRALGATGASADEIVANAVEWQGEREVREAALVVAGTSKVSKTAGDNSAAMLDWLGLAAEARAENWQEWRGRFLKADGEVRAAGGFVSKAVTDRHPDLLGVFLREGERVRGIDEQLKALRVAEISAALLKLADPVVTAYDAHKDRAGLLDYGDLIVHTAKVLFDPGAAWVLYKLDGGLDHLLLDEVQDIAPDQWDIAHALTEEFFAGEGARDQQRTVFAVGDRKQSIFGFQGADVATFEDSRRRIERRVLAADETFRDLTLDVSFRSTRPVLALVDAVFATPEARSGVVGAGETLTHRANRADHAGSVTLWPLAPQPEGEAIDPAAPADTNIARVTARGLLADRIAGWIAGQIATGAMLESQGRAVTAGDFMVLVRGREGARQSDAFIVLLVRALKKCNVPVAGLDRMVLTEQPAVADLLALAEALLLPEDDLTFACFLTSPLGGLNDDDLMALAIGRSGSLAEALRQRAGERPGWRLAWDFFAALLSRVDYATPYALFAEALGALGGRARLFARLGAEAAEPVAELLNAALTYSAIHPPSLQGFLRWIDRSGAEAKREAEAAGDLVRIMTVHGAKGLQAPIVILPDTVGMPMDRDTIFWCGDPAVPLWSPRADLRSATIDAAKAAGRQRAEEEYHRLLYVALTRAEDHLVVCGWEQRKALDPGCWYSLVSRGFESLADVVALPDAWGLMRRHDSRQKVQVEARGARAADIPVLGLPGWIGHSPDWRALPPPAEPSRPMPLAPSRPDGVELGTVPAAASPLSERMGAGDRFQRGQLIHGLLQHLPELPAAERAKAARRYLDRPGNGLAGSVDEVVAEVLRILDHPELAPLFGPDSRAEVPLTGVVGGHVVGGLVDRLAVLADRVLVGDFKTNRRPPDSAAATPMLYLRQMALYRAVLRAIFPDRDVVCALIWTRDARVVILPDEILDPHIPRPAPVAA